VAMPDLAAATYVRRDMIAPTPPPQMKRSPVRVLRERLFNGPGNSILTVLSVVLLAGLAWPTFRFLLVDAVWQGADRTACLAQADGREVGACWPFITAKFDQLMFGFYPLSERWRVALTYLIGALLLGPLLVPRIPYKLANAVLFFGFFP